MSRDLSAGYIKSLIEGYETGKITEQDIWVFLREPKRLYGPIVYPISVDYSKTLEEMAAMAGINEVSPKLRGHQFSGKMGVVEYKVTLIHHPESEPHYSTLFRFMNQHMAENHQSPGGIEHVCALLAQHPTVDAKGIIVPGCQMEWGLAGHTQELIAVINENGRGRCLDMDSKTGNCENRWYWQSRILAVQQ